MSEEYPLKTEEPTTQAAIAETLVAAAEAIETGTVTLNDGTNEALVSIPDEPTFEVELERVTDSETGVRRYELEDERAWTE